MFDQLGRMWAKPEVKAISFAYVTSLFSKVGTLAVQLLALPIIVHSIGTERFGIVFALASVAVVACIPALSASSVASQEISYQLGKSSDNRAEQRFWAFLFTGMAGATVFMLLGATFAAFFDPTLIFGNQISPYISEVKLGILAATAHIFGYYAFGYMDGIRAAHAENHISNIVTAIGALASLIMCFLIYYIDLGSVYTYYLAVFSLPAFFQILNLVTFIRKRGYKFHTPHLIRNDIFHVGKNIFVNAKMQAGYVLHLNLGVLISTRMVGLEAGALHAAVNWLFVLFHSTLVTLANPVTPWISRNLSAGNHRKAWLFAIFATGILLSLSLALAVFFGAFGKIVIDIWLGIQTSSSDQVFWLFGLFFGAYSCTHLSYIILMHLGRIGHSANAIFLSALPFLALLFVPEDSITLELIVTLSSVSLLTFAGSYCFFKLAEYLWSARK